MPTEGRLPDPDARPAAVAAEPAAGRGHRPAARLGTVVASDRIRELGFATAVVAAAVLFCAAVESYVPVASLALVFVCSVLVVAAWTRRIASVYAALLCFLAYNFFFTEPRFTFRIHGPQDVVAVASFLVAALAAGHLASLLRAQVILLRDANERTRTLQAMGEELAAAADAGQVYEAGCAHLAEALGCETVALVRAAGGSQLRRAASRPAAAQLEADDLAVADWVVEHARAAGRFTSAPSGSPWWFVPLVVEGDCLGAVGSRFPAAQTLLATEQRQLAEAMIQQVALAADRTRLVQTLERARVESETERLRTALLSSVSHDLRSPLAAIIGSATSLAAYGETMPARDRSELLESIRSEGERLDNYIQNLLDMTRLGSGPMKLQRDWVGLEEIVASALVRLRRLFPSAVVSATLSPGLPPLFVHAALIEQALFNILENAAKFSPPGAPIELRAKRDGESLVLDVTDRGPGIPEQDRRRIFDLFYSAARGDRAPRGSGLGLTIVRGMVGAHGGRVEAMAGPGGAGTTIRVTLPLTEPPRAEAPGEEA